MKAYSLLALGHRKHIGRSPPYPGDQGGLEGQPQPEQNRRDARVALGLQLHVEVGREHGDEQGDQPSAGQAAQSREEGQHAKGDLRVATRRDKLLVGG